MHTEILASLPSLEPYVLGDLDPTQCSCSPRTRHAGFVTGLDMTDEMLQVAKAHAQEYTTKLGYAKPNLKFIKGYIERLLEAGIADDSIDMIISNCVVNLSPDKPSVLREAFRVLAPGGELYFSDVYCDRRLPESVQKHEVCCGLHPGKGCFVLHTCGGRHSAEWCAFWGTAAGYEAGNILMQRWVPDQAVRMGR